MSAESLGDRLEDTLEARTDLISELATRLHGDDPYQRLIAAEQLWQGADPSILRTARAALQTETVPEVIATLKHIVKILT